MLENIFLLLWGVPKSSIVHWRHRQFLCNSCDPGWDSLLAGMIVWNDEGDLIDAVSLLQKLR
jgi:hypothetical protein